MNVMFLLVKRNRTFYQKAVGGGQEGGDNSRKNEAEVVAGAHG